MKTTTFLIFVLLIPIYLMIPKGEFASFFPAYEKKSEMLFDVNSDDRNIVEDYDMKNFRKDPDLVKVVENTMLRATKFMAEKVSTNGGYLWQYLPDFSRRWGEMEAYETMIWGQNDCGGWNYIIDFAGDRSLKNWYNTYQAGNELLPDNTTRQPSGRLGQGCLSRLLFF